MNPLAVCVIGSSHTGAIKRAWSNRWGGICDDLSITFFAAGGANMRRLRYEDGVLRPDSDHVRKLFMRTSGGQGEIVLQRYDALVMYAMGLSFAAVLEMAAGFCTASHRGDESDGRLVSSACFSRLMQAAVAQSGTMNCLSQIRPDYDRPIYVCATPLPPEGLFQETQSRLPARFRDEQYLASLFAQFRRTAEMLCGKCGAELIWQDDRTFKPPCFTKTEFSYTAPTSRGALREEYNKHMNEEFGAIAIENILARVDRTSGGRMLGARSIAPGDAASIAT